LLSVESGAELGSLSVSLKQGGAGGRGDRQGPPDAVLGRLRTPIAASGRPVDIMGSGAPEMSAVWPWGS